MFVVNLQHVMLARESRGMSQKDVAEKMGMTPTNLSKIERGDVKLSPENLARIGEVTGYPVSFFLQPGGVSPETWVWRKRKKVAQNILTYIHARVNIHRFQIHTITNELGLKPPKLPLMNISPSFSAEDAARALRKAWDIPGGSIANLTSIAEAHGIPVWSFSFGTDRMDSGVVHTTEHFPVICINSDHPGDRQRWSLAYQLGHLLMHVFNPVGEERDPGHEANLFAAELLIPEATYKQDLEGKTVTMNLLRELKRKWKMSMISLLYRADNLGCVSEYFMRNLIQQFHETKMIRHEPTELEVPAEQPKLIKSWVGKIRKRKGLDTEGMAALLHLRPEEYEGMFGK